MDAAKASSNWCCWKSLEDHQNNNGENTDNSIYAKLGLLIKTGMSYYFNKSPSENFVVCYTSSKLEFKRSRIRFLKSLEKDLFIEEIDISVGEEIEQITEPVEISPISNSTLSTSNVSALSAAISDGEIRKSDSHMFSEAETPPAKLAVVDPNQLQLGNVQQEQVDDGTFTFLVDDISVKHFVNNDISYDDLNNVRHMADGSNSNIYLAEYRGQTVIVKIIKGGLQYDNVVLFEFEVEYRLLTRVKHPNIINVVGAGYVPRRFIVLEWLSGGSLQVLLSNNPSRPGLAEILLPIHRATFPFPVLLLRARDLADGLHYLHFGCHNGASIIHRDLKPENIGIAADGTLKIFDFGLAACVRSTTSNEEIYTMTGNTGSLRYMAPEVAAGKPYNEKVDVYSFAIMIWQMATDKVPFHGFNVDTFKQAVFTEGLRPKLNKQWPEEFRNLLARSWHADYRKRPSFLEITQELDLIIAKHNNPKFKFNGSSKKA